MQLFTENMYNLTDKPLENHKSNEFRSFQKEKDNQNIAQFVDSRPEASKQQKLQELGDNSSKANEIKQIQLMVQQGKQPIQLKSNVTWTTQDFEYTDVNNKLQTEEVGKKMVASLDPKDQKKFDGNSTTSKELPDLFNGLKAKWDPGSKLWVRGHLLNDHLNGSNAFPNLFPITGHANLDHLNSVESHIKDWIRDYDNIVYYEVNASQKGGETNKTRNAGGEFECYAYTKDDNGGKQTLYRTIESKPLLKGEDDDDHDFSAKKIHDTNLRQWLNDNQKKKGDKSNDGLPEPSKGMDEEEIEAWIKSHKKNSLFFGSYYETSL